MMRRILLAPAVFILLVSGGFSGPGTGLAASMADVDRRSLSGITAGEIADMRYRRWRQHFRPYHYPESPPVWHSGPRYRAHRDRDSNAHQRRECARTTGYRTDDYYRCIGPWWWPFLR